MSNSDKYILLIIVILLVVILCMHMDKTVKKNEQFGMIPNACYLGSCENGEWWCCQQ
jgi:hypothetical protein